MAAACRRDVVDRRLVDEAGLVALSLRCAVK
jgi:hypothetical protein